MAKLRGPDRVKAALEALSLDCKVLTLPGSTRTAEEAAEAVGCAVGEIAKSLVFRAGDRAVSRSSAATAGSTRPGWGKPSARR